jgi:hypothetical protein
MSYLATAGGISRIGVNYGCTDVTIDQPVASSVVRA